MPSKGRKEGEGGEKQWKAGREAGEMIALPYFPYCVYGHSDGAGKIFYVGSGRMSRAFLIHTRNHLWRRAFKSCSAFSVVILALCETEQAARNIELEEIKTRMPVANIVRQGRRPYPVAVISKRPRKYPPCERYGSHRFRMHRDGQRRCLCGFSLTHSE